MLNDLERKAWETRTGADKHPPELAMKVVLDKIERGQLKPKHAIVIVIEDDGESEVVSFYQAGTLTQLGAEGAMGRALRVSQVSE